MQNPSAFSCPAHLCPEPKESPPAGPQICPPAKGHVTGGDGRLGNARPAQQGSSPSHLCPSSSSSLPGSHHSLLHRPGSHTGSRTCQGENFHFALRNRQDDLVSIDTVEIAPGPLTSHTFPHWGLFLYRAIPIGPPCYILQQSQSQNLGSNTISRSHCPFLIELTQAKKATAKRACFASVNTQFNAGATCQKFDTPPL